MGTHEHPRRGPKYKRVRDYVAADSGASYEAYTCGNLIADLSRDLRETEESVSHSLRTMVKDGIAQVDRINGRPHIVRLIDPDA